MIDENSFTPMKASSVKNVHERLGAVGTVLRGKLTSGFGDSGRIPTH